MAARDDFPALRANEYRDAWCGQVLPDRIGSRARVAGWVHRRRDHGGLIFIDLRDRTGLVQLVFNPDEAADAHQVAHRLRSEDVITVSGEVVRRDPETVNPELPTGEVEIVAMVPTSEVLRYAIDLRSITGGRGRCSIRHSHYDPMPAHLVDKIANQAEPARA